MAMSYVLDTGYGQFYRLGAGRDNKKAALQCHARNPHRTRTDKSDSAGITRDTLLLESPLRVFWHRIGKGVFGCHQTLPLNRYLSCGNALIVHTLYGIYDSGGVREHLLGRVSAQRARAAEWSAIDGRNPPVCRAPLGSDALGRNARA
jgi:hypothetical protein